MDSSLWWMWIVVGIVLIILEIFTAGFVILWFGVAAIITAAPVYLGAPLEVIVATYALSLLILTTFVRKITLEYFSRSSKDIKTNVEAIIDSSGIVIEEIDIVKGTGKVRINKEIWTAISESDSTIPVDSRVVVKRIDGVKVIVTKEGT